MAESKPVNAEPAEPKCPECGVRGADHIVSQSGGEETESGNPWFDVAYCDGCGHIYGVFTKDVTARPPPPLGF